MLEKINAFMNECVDAMINPDVPLEKKLVLSGIVGNLQAYVQKPKAPRKPRADKGTKKVAKKAKKSKVVKLKVKKGRPAKAKAA